MPAITLEVLPASRGDCLWVECARPGLPPWRLLIDGGLPSCYGSLRERLMRLAGAGPLFIDLVVVTHIDSDHIGGLLPLFAETGLEVQFGDIWFNGPQMQRRSVAEGQRLVDLLGGAPGRRKLPWNESFDRGAVVTGGNGEFKTIAFANGPTLTLLSPTPHRLVALRNTWAADLQRMRRGEPEDEEVPLGPMPLDDLASLAATPTSNDQSIANGSSIAFLLEHAGRRCLFGADAFSTVLGPALTNLANSRDGKPIELDVFKLPHHASKKNVSLPLLNLTPAEHYVVSTNGERFSHPDDIALARVVARDQRPKTLWFNYRNPAIERWDDLALKKKHGYEVRMPPTRGEAGVLLSFPPKDS